MAKIKLILTSSVALAIILLAGSVSWYYLHTLPRQNEERLQMEKQRDLEQKMAKDKSEAEAVEKSEQTQILRTACLNSADDNMVAGFKYVCKNNSDINGGDISICNDVDFDNAFQYLSAQTNARLKNILSTRESEINVCFKKYPQPSI